MNKKVVCIVQARMGSNRLSGKVLKKIKGKSMILHIVERLSHCITLDQVVVATTTEEQDDLLCRLLELENIDYYRGSEEDVLDRYIKTAKKFNADIIVRITADCPLIHPKLIDDVVTEFKTGKYDYISPKSELGLIRGLDTEVFSFRALEKIDELAKEYKYREHVTLYIYRHPEEFNIGIFPIPNILNNPAMRLCVDEIDDFILIEYIYNRLYKENQIINIHDVIKLLNDNPELSEINANVKQSKV